MRHLLQLGLERRVRNPEHAGGGARNCRSLTFEAARPRRDAGSGDTFLAEMRIKGERLVKARLITDGTALPCVFEKLPRR